MDELFPGSAHETARHPIFQTGFALDDARSIAVECDISFTGGIVAVGGLEGTVPFRADLFVRGSIERLVNRLQVLASVLITSPDADVWTLPLMPPELSTWRLGHAAAGHPSFGQQCAQHRSG